MRHLSSSTLVRTVAVPACLALAVLVTGCGSSDTPSDVKAKSQALSSDQAASALLTAAEIGSGFKLDSSSDDSSDDDKPGCLADLDSSKVTAPVKADRDYAATNEKGVPQVSSMIRSYDDVDAAKAAFDTVHTAVKGCSTLDDTAKDGTVYKLSIVPDDTKSFTAGDDQLGFTATGSITVSGQEVQVVLTYLASRVKNSVTILSVTDIGTSATPGIADLFNTVGARLVAVADGKDPDA